ncbi:MAG: type II toxin-antitoxin system HicB family antitoxin [Candidatus Electrothrix sp. GM3_4]|nr:type II toxin-antitoxin system HicB family antitoxin [Candidatus Electrothrix sp. GM3_4]
MMNRIKINGCWAAVYYDPKHDMFRGEFVNLSSRVVFSSRDIGGLLRQGEVALEDFLARCRADGTEPLQEYSGELLLRIHPGLHAELAARAFASGKTVNQWLAEMIEQAVCAY